MKPTLYDVKARHHVYLEQVKLGAAALARPLVGGLAAAVRDLLGNVTVPTLGKLTRVQLRQLLVKLIAKQARLFQAFMDSVTAFLRSLGMAERRITIAIMQDFREPDDPPPKKRKLWLPLWASVLTSYIPGVGTTIPVFLSMASTASQSAISNAVQAAYANNLTPSEAVNKIVGRDEANFTDGLLNTIRRNNVSAINTAIQQASVQTQADVEADFVDSYQYVAVLDSRTTEICLSLDGKVFRYGQGPMPPQHINCRSTIVPIEKGGNPYPDIPFDEWFAEQSQEFQDDAGMNGKGKFSTSKTLTIAGLEDKLSAMLGDKPDAIIA
jgi:SPP1 gp7 family putative phage head morphogenesis protein